MSDTRLLGFFGYSSVNEILGHPLSAYSRDVSSQLDVWSYGIINDIRRVIDALWGGNTISGIVQSGQVKQTSLSGPLGNNCDQVWAEIATNFYNETIPAPTPSVSYQSRMFRDIQYIGVIAGRNYWNADIFNARLTTRFDLSDANVFQITGKHNNQIKQVKFQVVVAPQTSIGINKIVEFVTNTTLTLSATETEVKTSTFGDAKSYLGNGAVDFTMGGDDWTIIPDKPECPPMIATQIRQRGYIVTDFKLKLI